MWSFINEKEIERKFCPYNRGRTSPTHTSWNISWVISFFFFWGGVGVRFGFNELAEFAMVGTGREGNRLVQTSFATSTFFSDGKFWRIQMVTARFGLNIVDTNDEFMVRGLLRLHLWFFILSSPQRPVLLFLGYPHYK